MNSLACGLRSELLRYFSGYSVLGILAFSGLVPWFVANFLGWPQNSDRFQAADNVDIFWAVAASIAPVATFAGSYLVTRESYYGTFRRSVVTSGAMSVFSGKYVASLAVGMGTSLAGIVVWGGSVVFSLAPTTREQLLAPESLGPLGAVVLASSLGALWGCSLGWIIQHYYATTILTLLIPLAIELPLMANAPEVARWLPSGALAGVVSLPMEGLLEPVAAFLLSVAWTLIAGVGALWVVRRREF